MAGNRRGKANISRVKMASIYEAAQRRCHDIAAEMVAEISAAAPHVGPYVTGRLAGSYRVDTASNGDALVRTSAPYWKYVEFGTRKHGSKQPHVRPGIEAVRARRG